MILQFTFKLNSLTFDRNIHHEYYISIIQLMNNSKIQCTILPCQGYEAYFTVCCCIEYGSAAPSRGISENSFVLVILSNYPIFLGTSVLYHILPCKCILIHSGGGGKLSWSVRGKLSWSVPALSSNSVDTFSLRIFRGFVDLFLHLSLNHKSQILIQDKHEILFYHLLEKRL